MTERDDRLPTATLAEWLRTLADSQDRQAHHDAGLLREAADRLEELTAALREFTEWVDLVGAEKLSLGMRITYRRAAELLGEEPTK